MSVSDLIGRNAAVIVNSQHVYCEAGMEPNYSLNELWKLLEIGRSLVMGDHLARLPGMQELFATGEDPDAVLSRVRRIIDAISDLE